MNTTLVLRIVLTYKIKINECRIDKTDSSYTLTMRDISSGVAIVTLTEAELNEIERTLNKPTDEAISQLNDLLVSAIDIAQKAE